jgi:hypothetical protein
MWAILTYHHIINLEIGLVPHLVAWTLLFALSLTVFALGIGSGPGEEGGSSGSAPPFPCGPLAIPPGWPCLPDFGNALPPPNQFTPVARQSLEIARAEAARLGHDFIGTEHVLLGLLKLPREPLSKVLRDSHMDGETVRREIERLAIAQFATATETARPLTPRARKALRLAGREAKSLNQPLINGEHILLGLLIEGSGLAAQVMRNLGIRIERIREAIAAA